MLKCQISIDFNYIFWEGEEKNQHFELRSFLSPNGFNDACVQWQALLVWLINYSLHRPIYPRIHADSYGRIM